MSPRVKREIDAIGARSWAPLLAIGLFAIAFTPPGVVFLDNILNAAGPVLLAVLFFGALAKQGPLCRLVNMVWLRVGADLVQRLSQQLSLGPTSTYGGHWLLSLPFFFLAPALISYSGICWYGPLPMALLIQLGGSSLSPQASRARRQPR